MKKLTLILSSLLLLVACGKVQPPVQPAVQPINQTPEVLSINAETNNEVPVTTQDLLENLKNGQNVEEIKPVSLILLADIKSGQIKKYFKLGDIYLALVLQPSMNIYFEELGARFEAKFFGVLVAKEGQTQWQKLLTITDKDSSPRNNPYYLWNDNKKLFLSIVDSGGAGSGEGIEKVYTLNNEGDWDLIGCYYFGGNYRSESLDGDNFAYSSKLDKQEKQSLDHCQNVNLIK